MQFYFYKIDRSTMGHEVGQRRRLLRLAPVREEEKDDRLGHEGELGRPRGRGPVGRGGGDNLLKREKMGRGWAEMPDGPAGCWANWVESEEKFFSK
jgi:hypothetical protein